jgi:hypothetical protein
VLGVISLAPGGCGRPGEVWVEIGEFQSKDAGMRAAVKRLAVEIQENPNAERYRIVWTGPFSDEDDDARQSIDRRALVYCLPVKWLGYEHDVDSGIAGRKYIVDRADIKAVAEKGGSLEDFDEYDQSPPSTRKDAPETSRTSQ